MNGIESAAPVTKKISDYLLFCDSSFDPKSHRGVGGRLLLSRDEFSHQIHPSDLRVRTKLFANMTNTRLELITVLWALNHFKKNFHEIKTNKSYYPDIIVFSDCKTISDLQSRRRRLENGEYKSKRTGRLLSNADLYKKYFLLSDEIQPEIIWTKGHTSSRHHNVIQSLFSHVDKTTRTRLRELKASVS